MNFLWSVWSGRTEDGRRGGEEGKREEERGKERGSNEERGGRRRVQGSGDESRGGATKQKLDTV